MVGVGRVRDAQDMRGQSESLGDMTQAPDIAEMPFAQFQGRDVGLVVAQERTGLHLAGALDVPVVLQDRSQVA